MVQITADSLNNADNLYVKKNYHLLRVSRKFLSFCLAAIIGVTIISLFGGCAAESPNPLAIEKLHGFPPKQEKLSMQLDARGIINGVFQPGDIVPYNSYFYPVSYIGSWKLIESGTRSNLYTITSNVAGARVDIVATLSRVVFDFWDYEFYDNPGKVSFYIDDVKLGTFDLARASASDQKILNYQIATQKNTVATISMVLEEGRVVISGYLMNFLDERYPY